MGAAPFAPFLTLQSQVAIDQALGITTSKLVASNILIGVRLLQTKPHLHFGLDLLATCYNRLQYIFTRGNTMLQSVEAKVIDAQHLQLNQPILIPAGSTVLVTIAAPEESDRQVWYTFSRYGLATAYGDDEPDYSVKLIKEPNPEYQP